MKNLALTAASVVMTFLVQAQKLQNKDVPANLKSEFQKQFPTAKSVKWEKEKTNFEVDFNLGNIERSAVFDIQGNLMETEVEIKVNELPAGASDYIKTNYKNQTIKEAAKITDAKGVITYEAEIKGMDIIFDSTGKFVKEVKE